MMIWLWRIAWVGWFVWLALVLIVVIAYVYLGAYDDAAHSGVSLLTVIVLTFNNWRYSRPLVCRAGLAVALVAEVALLIAGYATQRAGLQPMYWDGVRHMALGLCIAASLSER